jgi:hypothetical protein
MNIFQLADAGVGHASHSVSTLEVQMAAPLHSVAIHHIKLQHDRAVLSMARMLIQGTITGVETNTVSRVDPRLG